MLVSCYRVQLKDTVFDDTLSFLEEADRLGKGIVTVIGQGGATTAASLTGASGGGFVGNLGASAAGSGNAAGDGGPSAGAGVGSVADAPGTGIGSGAGALPSAAARNVSYEARLMRRLFMALKDEH